MHVASAASAPAGDAGGPPKLRVHSGAGLRGRLRL